LNRNENAPAMIFHYPYPIGDHRSGSSVHATRLLNGFRGAGFQVFEMVGYPSQRRKVMVRVKRAAAQGRHISFLFAWSPVSSSFLGLANLLQPCLDYGFFRWCNRHSIPVGVFYGDVFRRFDFFKRQVVWWKRAMLEVFFWADWLNYRRTAQDFFIPSMPMGEFLPTKLPKRRLHGFPPGCDAELLAPYTLSPSIPLRLFYVGAIVPPIYDLKEMIDVIAETDGVEMTLCCRQEEWRKHRSYYRSAIRAPNVHVVHASGAMLADLYHAADVFAFYRRAHPYLKFCMPVKLFEAIGFGLPVISNAGTESAAFIEREQIGWTLSSKEQLSQLLQRLVNDRAEVLRKRTRAIAVSAVHTWRARAAQIEATLAGQRMQEIVLR